MKKTVQAIASIAAAFALVLTLAPADVSAQTVVKHPKKTILKLDGSQIDGELARPNITQIGGLAPTIFSSQVRVRSSFRAELMGSADEI